LHEVRIVTGAVCLTLVKPKNASLKVFNLKGGLISDLTPQLRSLNAGTVRLPLMLRPGAYAIAFDDGRTSMIRNIAVVK